MRTVNGCESCGGTVMGRLVFWGEMEKARGSELLGVGELCIVITEDMGLIDEYVTTERQIIGVVCYGERSYTEMNGISMLFVDHNCEDELRELDGQMAYLDCEKKILIASPDIETVNSYEEKRARGVCLEKNVDSARLPKISLNASTVKEQESGFLYLDDLLKNEAGDLDDREELVFELVSNHFGRAPAHSLCVAVNFIEKVYSKEAFTIIRALYRASVYGDLSIMCGGIRSLGEVKELSRVFGESFCELESEGREINGFMKKGLICGRASLLFSLLSVCDQKKRKGTVGGMDFIAFDLDDIEREFFGCCTSQVSIEDEVKGIAKAGSLFSKRKIIVRKNSTIELFRKVLFGIGGAEEIYTEETLLGEIKEIILKAIGEGLGKAGQ